MRGLPDADGEGAEPRDLQGDENHGQRRFDGMGLEKLSQGDVLGRRDLAQEQARAAAYITMERVYSNPGR